MRGSPLPTSVASHSPFRTERAPLRCIPLSVVSFFHRVELVTPTSFSSPTSTTSYIFEAAIPLAFTAGPEIHSIFHLTTKTLFSDRRGCHRRVSEAFQRDTGVRYVKLVAFLAASVLADDRVRATDGTVGAGAAGAAAGSRSGEDRMMAPAVILTTAATRKR